MLLVYKDCVDVHNVSATKCLSYKMSQLQNDDAIIFKTVHLLLWVFFGSPCKTLVSYLRSKSCDYQYADWEVRISLTCCLLSPHIINMLSARSAYHYYADCQVRIQFICRLPLCVPIKILTFTDYRESDKIHLPVFFYDLGESVKRDSVTRFLPIFLA